jgi:hypothetical protein
METINKVTHTQVNNYITLRPSGYGHKKVIVYLLNGNQLTSVTSNMPLIDKYNSENDEESQEAKEKLIDMTLAANGITEYEIV